MERLRSSPKDGPFVLSSLQIDAAISFWITVTNEDNTRLYFKIDMITL